MKRNDFIDQVKYTTIINIPTQSFQFHKKIR